MDNWNFQHPKTIHSLDDLLETAPRNQTIGDNLIRAWHIINNDKYKKICCSVSAGSDSDIVVDICSKVDIHHKITYVNYNTGLEYAASKEHIGYLEERYGIEIKIYKAWEHGMTVPASCKKYGQPFMNKTASEYIHRLQLHNFKWENKPFEELYKEYPHCKAALDWWCNRKKSNANNICNNKWLKEFLIENPPDFPISNICCKKSKKDISHKTAKKEGFDLMIVGVRKAEGGARATSYKNCYSCDRGNKIDEYRPIYWYKDEDKRCYEQHYMIVNSKCYTEYGLKRTGCCGCPFGRNSEFELEVLKKYEPKLYKAVCNVFRDSYEYTRRYRDFQIEMNRKSKDSYQLTIDDFLNQKRSHRSCV